MNFNVDLKKMVRDAGTAVSRVVQLTEEKLGTSEKTELDAHFENLSERAETTKQWTEKMLKDTESVLTPNPGYRVEDFLYEKIEKKRPHRLSNLEYLGQDMIEAANDFGSGTPYGATLLMVGQCQRMLGQVERDFIAAANQCYLVPLRKYLDGEMKTITTEKGILETRRLDLDACKNRVRKARSMLGQPTKEGPSPEYLLELAERDLRVAQSEFDRQVEITKLLLESVGNSLTSHHRYLHDFVDAQLNYYQQCEKVLQDLKNQMAKHSPCMVRNPSSASENTLNSTSRRKAKVVISFKAWTKQEISVERGQILSVEKIDSEDEYVFTEVGNQKGKVPVTHLEFID